MTTAAIRERLHHFIDTMEDKKAAAIYTLFADSMEEKEAYSEEFKAELDLRYAEYKEDGKTITREAMDKRVRKIIHRTK